jgi:CAAX protease family protein
VKRPFAGVGRGRLGGMAQPGGTPTEAETSAPGPLDEAERRALALEIGAVAVLAVVSPTLTALGILLIPGFYRAQSVTAEFVGILSVSCQVAAPVLFLMWRSGRAWSSFGIARPRWYDPLLALVVYAAAYVAMLMGVGIDLGFRAQQPLTGFLTQPRGAEWVLVVLIAVVNGGTEELVMRGYLIPRIERYCGSALVAVIATSVMFGAYHLYYGYAGAIQITAMGLVLGGVFCATRRLWPVALAHMLADVLPYLWG